MISEHEEPATAYHEAGHVMALFALGFGFDGVTVLPDIERETAGHVVPRPPRIVRERDRRAANTAYERESVQNYIVVLLAGAEAQARYLGVPVLEVVRSGGPRNDWQLAELLAEGLEAPSVAPALFGYLNARTRDLIDVHWYLVEALAVELLIQQSLSRRSVLALLSRAIRQAAAASTFHDLVAHDMTAAELRELAELVGREKTGA